MKTCISYSVCSLSLCVVVWFVDQEPTHTHTDCGSGQARTRIIARFSLGAKGRNRAKAPNIHCASGALSPSIVTRQPASALDRSTRCQLCDRLVSSFPNVTAVFFWSIVCSNWTERCQPTSQPTTRRQPPLTTFTRTPDHVHA